MFPAVKVVHSNIKAASTGRSLDRAPDQATRFHGYVLEMKAFMEFDHFLTIPHRQLDGAPLRSAAARRCTGLSTAGVDKLKKRLRPVSCAIFVACVTASRCKRWTPFTVASLSLDLADART
jgi:hypothetical protein